eukprot:COSAG04_NODE_2228_length_4487_cov_1.793072_1_plen_33_part_10
MSRAQHRSGESMERGNTLGSDRSVVRQSKLFRQ